MKELKDDQFVLEDEEGNETVFNILFTFDSEETNKSYVVFYNEEADLDDEDLELFAKSYIEDDEGNSGELFDIEDDAEWDMIEEMLKAFEESDLEE